MEQHAAQTVARVLCADQVRQRQRDLLGRREAVLSVEDHAVAAIEHEDRRAGALIFGLMHVKIGVLEIKRDAQALTPHGGEQCFADIEIQRVAEFITLRGSR